MIIVKILKGTDFNPVVFPLIFILLTILKLSLGLFLNFWTGIIQKNAKEFKVKTEIDVKRD